MRVWAKGPRIYAMHHATTPSTPGDRPFSTLRKRLLGLGLGAGIVLVGGVVLVCAPGGYGRLLAQIEGDRGIAPVVNTGNIEVSGIEVNATGRTAQEARDAGWHQAWVQAWAKTQGPALDEATIEGLVSSVVVESEEIGPHHYHARLRVEFDRARAGQFAAGENGAVIRRSAPMLVIPVLYSGGVSQVFEVRGEWQRAWAEYRTGASAINYVRPSGGGGDSLLLTAGQTGRRSRLWWRTILDQFGAADVVMPVARLERQWPGGPVHGTFTARYGPDNAFLGSFTMDAPDEASLPAMLAQAITRIDGLYTDALTRGLLRPDASLTLEHPGAADPGISGLIALGRKQKADEAAAAAAQAALAAPDATNPALPLALPSADARAGAKPSVKAAEVALTIQFASPDARAVDTALAALKSVPGASGVAITSIAIGGTSVMHSEYAGTPAELAAGLRARGWQVATNGAVLKIRR